MQEFVIALQEIVHATLEDTERIAQVKTKSKDLYKITDIINHLHSYFIHQILIALLMVFALIKDNVMAQSASVYVIKVLLESIVKVILYRLKFYHSEKYMPKDDIFLDKSCSGESPPCNGNGQCNHTTGLCMCNEGNQGSDCSGNSYKL